MRMRLGLAVGFGAGYYLGTKAGRERYDQLNEFLGRARSSDAYETAAEKTKAAVDLGVERAREVVTDIRDTDQDDGAQGTEAAPVAAHSPTPSNVVGGPPVPSV